MPSGSKRPFARFARYRKRTRSTDMAPISVTVGAGTAPPQGRSCLPTERTGPDVNDSTKDRGIESHSQPQGAGVLRSNTVDVRIATATALPKKRIRQTDNRGGCTPIPNPATLEAGNGGVGRALLICDSDPFMHPGRAARLSKYLSTPSPIPPSRGKRPLWDKSLTLSPVHRVSRRPDSATPSCDFLENSSPRKQHVLTTPHRLTISQPGLPKMSGTQMELTQKHEGARDSTRVLGEGVKGGRGNILKNEKGGEGLQRLEEVQKMVSREALHKTATGQRRKSETGRQSDNEIEQRWEPFSQLDPPRNNLQQSANEGRQSGETMTQGGPEILYSPFHTARPGSLAREANDPKSQPPVRHHSKLSYSDDVRILTAWRSFAARPNSCSYDTLALDVTNAANDAGAGPTLRFSVVEHRMRMLREAFDDIIYLSVQGCIKRGSEVDHFTFFNQVQEIILKSREARKARSETDRISRGVESSKTRARRKLLLDGVPIAEIVRYPNDISLFHDVRERTKAESKADGIRGVNRRSPGLVDKNNQPQQEALDSDNAARSVNGDTLDLEPCVVLKARTEETRSLVRPKELHIRNDHPLEEGVRDRLENGTGEGGEQNPWRTRRDATTLPGPQESHANSFNSESKSGMQRNSTHLEGGARMYSKGKKGRVDKGRDEVRMGGSSAHGEEGSKDTSQIHRSDSLVVVGAEKVNSVEEEVPSSLRVASRSMIVLRARSQVEDGQDVDDISERSLTVKRTEDIGTAPSKARVVCDEVPPSLSSDAVQSQLEVAENAGMRGPNKRRRVSKTMENDSSGSTVHVKQGVQEPGSIGVPRSDGKKNNGRFDSSDPKVADKVSAFPQYLADPAAVHHSPDVGAFVSRTAESSVREVSRGPETRAEGLRNKAVLSTKSRAKKKAYGRKSRHEGMMDVKRTFHFQQRREKRRQVIAEMRAMAVALDKVNMPVLAWKYKTRLLGMSHLR